MKSALRNFVLAATAAASLSACGSKPKSVGDVLAEDSTLVREVMSANRDSLTQPEDTALSAPEPSEVASVAPATVPATSADTPVSAPTPAVAIPSVSRTRSTSSSPRKSRVVTDRQVSSRSVGSPRRTRSVAANGRSTRRTVTSRISDTVTPSTRVATRPAASPAPLETTPMRSSALIPAGHELALASDQRVCASMSQVGDTFTTHLTQDVVGPVGVVIPKGTIATAQVSSVRKDFGFTIQSLVIDGRTYQIGSDVTHADIENARKRTGRNTRTVAAGAGLGAVMGGVIGRDVKSAVIGAAGGMLAGAVAARPTYRSDSCIPTGGQITAQLTEPLRLSLSE